MAKSDAELEPKQPKKTDAKAPNPAVEPVAKKKNPLESPATLPETKVEPTAEPKSEPKAEEVPVVKSEAKSNEAATGEVTTVRSKRRFSLEGVNAKSLAIKVGAVFLAALVLITLIFGVLIYGYKSESAVVYTVSGVIPYPAERVNGSFVSYHAYLFEVEANKRAYQNNAKLNNQPAVDYNTADGKKLLVGIKQHALDKLKSDEVVAILAKQNKVVVTSKDVDELLASLYKQYGGKTTLLKTLKSIYNWNLDDLKSVVHKQLVAKKLQDKVTADPAAYAQAKTKADDVIKQLKAGGDFAALAKQYSHASDASSGGDLGTFTKGQVPDEIQKAIDALQVGDISDPVKTQYGYEIVKAVAKGADGKYQASHILITTVDFTTYMNDQVKKAKVNVYIKV